MTPQEQLLRWQKGESVHNPDRDECCPDLSCCTPALQADQETRNAFTSAYLSDDEDTVNRFLMDFLGLMLKEEKVHVTG